MDKPLFEQLGDLEATQAETKRLLERSSAKLDKATRDINIACWCLSISIGLLALSLVIRIVGHFLYGQAH
jgi:hypothetical protein